MAFTMAEKNKIKTEFARRYRKANKAEKTKILDDFIPNYGIGYYSVSLNGRFYSIRKKTGGFKRAIYPFAYMFCRTFVEMSGARGDVWA